MDDQPLSFDYDSARRTLRVSGSVDELSGVELRDQISKHSSDYTEQLTVDLGGVDLLPSAGVGVIAVAMREAEERGVSIDLVAVRDSVVQRVLTICGLPFTER
jgi:anti-anti-sigma factor